MDQNELHIETCPSPLSARERTVLYCSARLLDLHLWTLGAAAIWLGVMGGRAFERETLLTALLLILPVLAGLMIVDAIVHGVWGTTPGNRLLGISVTTREGAPLTLGAHLWRNGAIWLRQLACFIPPLTLVTLWFCVYRLQKGKPWSYDKKHAYEITIRPPGKQKMARFCLALLTTSALIMTLVTVILRALVRQYLIL